MDIGGSAWLAHQRYSVAYLRRISLTWSFVICFGGMPGGLQVSRKKLVQPWRRDNPEQQQLVIGICEPMPSVLGDEYRSALLEGVTYVVQIKHPLPSKM